MDCSKTFKMTSLVKVVYQKPPTTVLRYMPDTKGTCQQNDSIVSLSRSVALTEIKAILQYSVTILTATATVNSQQKPRYQTNTQTGTSWATFLRTQLPTFHRVTNNKCKKMKKALRGERTLRAGCIKVDPKICAPLQTPFLGARDGQNLISWRWSLPLPTNPV